VIETRERKRYVQIRHTTQQETAAQVSQHYQQCTHLLSRSRLDEIGFGYDFDGVILSGIHGGAEVHFGKATLSQKTSQSVTMQRVSLAVDAFALFLNHRLFVSTVLATIADIVGAVAVRALDHGTLVDVTIVGVSRVFEGGYGTRGIASIAAGAPRVTSAVADHAAVASADVDLSAVVVVARL